MKTEADYKGALKKFQLTMRKIKEAGDQTVKQITKEGVLKAKASAPFDSGKTARSIRSKYYDRGEDGADSIIIAPNAHKKEFKDRNPATTKFGPNFNLTRYMHSAKGISSGHFQRGRPDFMNITRAYLNKIKKGVAKGKFNKIKIN